MSHRRFFADLVVVALLAAIYFGAAKLGLALAFVNASATAVWPPTGIALAALLVLGNRAWPGVLLGAFLANVTTAGSGATAIAIAVGNTLEGLAGAYLVNRFANGRHGFDRARDIFTFVMLAAIVSTTVSATIGVTSLCLGGFASWANYGAIWLTWWLGDAVGALVVAPPLILWSVRPRLRWSARQVLELIILLLALILVGLTVFGGLLLAGSKNYPLEFVCLPLLIWAAFRFGQREAATVACGLSGIAIWGTVHGFGPFVTVVPNESLLLLQTFIGVAAVMSLVLAAAVSERKQAEEALQRAHNELELRVQERTASLAEAIEASHAEVVEREHAQAALQEAQDELEQRIQERTVELVQANAELRVEIGVRKQIEETLRESQERYRLIAENTGDIIMLLDQQGRFTYVSPSCRQVLGYDPAELIGHSGFDLVHPEDLAFTLEQRPQLASSGATQLTCRYRHADGSWRWLEARGTMVAQPDSRYTVAVGRDVTERKRAEATLRESKAQIEAILQGVSDGVTVQDGSGRLVYANDVAARMTGYASVQALLEAPRAEILQQFEIFDEAGQPFSLEHLPALLALQGIAGSEALVRFRVRATGEERWSVIKATPVYDEHGQPQLAINTFHDITLYKQAEMVLRQAKAQLETRVAERTAELRAANERLQSELSQHRRTASALAEAQRVAHIGSWEWHIATNRLTWSDELYRLFGLKPQECALDYETYLARLHPDDRVLVDRAIQRAQQERQPFAFDHRIILPDGTVRWLHGRGEVSVAETGQPIRLQGTAQDITERKRAELALHASEERFSRAFHASPATISITTLAGGCFLDVNESFLDLMGYQRDEIIGHTASELGVWPRADDRARVVQALREQGSVRGIEISFRTKSGEILETLASIELIDLGGERCMLTLTQDISERRRAEAALKTFATTLERRNRELQEFASVASHDLQEPLRKVQAFGDLLRTEYSATLDVEGRDYLKRIQNAASRMQTLINDLLLLARLGSDARPFVMVDLNWVAREVVADLEAQIGRTGARVELGDLPTIEADPLQMRQLLQNVIGNALKFCRPEKPPVVKIRNHLIAGAELRLAGSTPGDPCCQISVEDNGIGFDEKYLDRIFAVFQRLHGRGEYEGTGIGLAICRRIVERHGGSITATSTPGQGTTFFITLPLHQASGRIGSWNHLENALPS
jgi:two-component system sensor kinase FixL